MTSRLKLPHGSFSAYIFDLDGTIADSMPVHFQAWTSVLKTYGCEFPEDLFYSWGGVPTPEIVRMLNEKYGLSMPVDEVLHKKESLYQLYLPQVKPIPEVLEVIQSQHGKIPFAVVSGGPKETVRLTLEALQLGDLFEAVLGAEDYARGKPAPDGFLLAARKLNVKPQSCLVFEDADLGIAAARAAGMNWVKVNARTSGAQ